MSSDGLGTFPDPRTASPEGLVAVGGNLTVELLKEAYSEGIFPWPQEGYPMLWFSPDPRGVLDFAELHINRSLDKWLRKEGPRLRFTVSQAFDQVIEGCKEQKRPGQESTWILPVIVSSYQRLFAAGHILSGECWEGDELIGGIYGVLSDKYFSAESMFYKKPNASKYCFLKMVEHLQRMGHQWMDIQMVTEVTSSLGGKLIAREEFLGRIGR